MAVQFGEFELDRDRRQLLRSGRPVPLEPKAYELLSLLVKRRPTALSRAQIRDVVWPGVFVSESTVGVVVNSIRQALGDDARQPRFIRTVHGFGYAFCGETVDEAEAREASRVGEEPRPYPGLLAFTEADAEHFFGREADVAALWEKIRRHKLLAVIGPSGVGKTSFLRAGVIPGRPQGWRVVYATPGPSPVFSLAHALAPELVGDAGALEELLQGIQDLSLRGDSERALSAVRRWRSRGDEALLVMDQFEELFALNPSGMQSVFAGFLGRLAEETDVHALLSLRDDFLFRCSAHEGLQPVFQELTPLTAPSPEALRRALAEPSARHDVRFEDDTLIEQMVEAVTGERGALPLLAFAASRLWEERDRERKLLTQEAYERIDGVAGAIAHHAEATLSGLGPEREGVVREIFRNLVTAAGTRAARTREELLSVFGDTAHEAERVLETLVDARLLTEYEAPVAEAVVPASSREGSVNDDQIEAHHRRIEIVHESLLTHWPRLARWQTQDADGAQLRDQLRQAAHLWDECGRPEDLLWTGASYLDFRAWRARYPGGLSASEEEFAQAMAALAGRRRRRRRVAVAAVVAALTIGIAVLGTFWSRSESARRRADLEALRAESRKLLALGQVELERYPTAALAYATKSLELADTEEARHFALRVLQRGPTAFEVSAPLEDRTRVAFSPDGEWLAVGGARRLRLCHRDGRQQLMTGGEPAASYGTVEYGFGLGGRVLVGDYSGEIRIWSVPGGRLLRRARLEEGASRLFVRGAGCFTSTTVGGREVIRWTPLIEGDSRLVGVTDAAFLKTVDAAGSRMAYVPGAYASGRRLYVRPLDDWSTGPRLVATHQAEITDMAFHPDGRHVAAGDRSGHVRIWPTAGGSNTPTRVLDSEGGVFGLTYSPRGRWLAVFGGTETTLVRVWDLAAPSSVGPLTMPLTSIVDNAWAFDPSERWLATLGHFGAAVWPLGETYPRSVEMQDWFVDDVAFSPDGSTLLSVSGQPDCTLRARSLLPDDPGTPEVLVQTPLNLPRISVDPTGERVAVSAWNLGPVLVVSLSGGSALKLEGFPETAAVHAVAFSPDGRRVAAGALWGPPDERVIRVWDLREGTTQVLGPLPDAGEGETPGVGDLGFLDDDRLVAASVASGLLLFDLRDGAHTRLSSRPAKAVAVDRQNGVVFTVLGEPEEIVKVRLDGERPKRVASCPACYTLAVDSTGTVLAASSSDGIVRIGSASGGEPHLFFGGSVTASPRTLTFSRDGHWVASAGEAHAVHLWPVPDVTRTPLDKRSHEEVLAKLNSWTNLRAVRDPESPTGWTLEAGPFPGWEHLPRW